jgi:hypothetical protein
MKSAFVMALMVFMILSALCAVQTVNAADKIPLKRGIYVLEGVPCKDADTASTLNFNGNGFNSAHVGATIINIRNNGNIYHITQKFEGLGGVGGEGTYTGQWTVTIKSRTSFSISDAKIGGKPLDNPPSTYRYCHD